tara:strand:+ start:1747 stop:2172 length:426 start_codon:yes stop_codon:yes gene_type:complete
VKNNTTIRVNDKTIEYYTNNFKNNHAGARIAVEGYPYLREEAIKLLKEQFSPDEVMILLSSTPSNLRISDMISRRKWEAEIADFCEERGHLEDLPTIIKKVRVLSPIERFVMRELLDGCLNNPKLPDSFGEFVDYLNNSPL